MTTHVLAYAELEKAQRKAREYSTDHKVMIVGQSDEVEVKNDGEASAWWAADLYVVIATTDEIVGPQP